MNENAKYSPRIEQISWGKIKVAGVNRSYRDAKLFPGGAREWDWNETGTNHTPGIQPADVKELIENGARVVVLSRGMNRQLNVCPETLSLLKRKGIKVHALETDAAVKLYNRLVDDEPVGGLIHTTC